MNVVDSLYRRRLRIRWRACVSSLVNENNRSSIILKRQVRLHQYEYKDSSFPTCLRGLLEQLVLVRIYFLELE